MPEYPDIDDQVGGSSITPYVKLTKKQLQPTLVPQFATTEAQNSKLEMMGSKFNTGSFVSPQRSIR